MGKRREHRIVVSIPVRIHGVDQNSNPFSQTAQTIDVSRTGARLSGVRCFRGPGEMITIECGASSARFMVVWIGQPGTDEDGHFGVKALQPEKRIFRVDLGEPRLDGYQAPAEKRSEPFAAPKTPAQQWDHHERRVARRMCCSGTGHIRQEGVAFPIWAKITDLSSGGCYVELVFTIGRGTTVDMQLTVNNRTFGAQGTVVTSHPGVGVGVKFTEVGKENRAVLAEILRELTERAPGAFGSRLSRSPGPRADQ